MTDRVAYLFENIVTWVKDEDVHIIELKSRREAVDYCEKLIDDGVCKCARENGRLMWFEGHDPNDPYAMLSTW